MYAPDQFLSVQTISTGNYRLIQWNITGYAAIGTSNIRMNVMSNVSYPFSSLGVSDYESIITVISTGIRSVPASGVPADWEATAAVNSGVIYNQNITAVSLTTGQILWNMVTPTSYGGFFSGSTQVADHGRYAAHFNDGHWYCWDLKTGQLAWTSQLSSYPWGVFGVYGVNSYGGTIIYAQYDGVVAYNWTDGTVAWRFQAPAAYPYETPYQNDYPFYNAAIIIADGKVYASNTEHTVSEPVTRGWSLYCMNATTGAGIWNVTGEMSPGAVADGYLTAGNEYDGYMYVFGKGPSITTVSAPQTQITGAERNYFWYSDG